jgi:plastocyanin
MGSTRPLTGVARLLLAAAAVLLVGCGSSGGDAGQTSSGAGPARGGQLVTIEDYVYQPATITVAPGTTVSFDNEDSTAHTATSSDSGAFDTDAIQAGKSGTVTLDEAGTFSYYCVFHPFMKGKIVVE